MSALTEKQIKNRKIFTVLFVILWIIIVIGVIVDTFIEKPKTASIEIKVAPSNASVKIGGSKYRAGTHKIRPGDYSVEAYKEGFTSYISEFSVAEGETQKILICLRENDGIDWYSSHKEDDDICRTVDESESELAKKERSQKVSIYTITPFHSYDYGFNIDTIDTEDKNKPIIKITLLSCKETRIEALKENALEWLKKRNIEPEEYEIKYESGCE